MAAITNSEGRYSINRFPLAACIYIYSNMILIYYTWLGLAYNSILGWDQTFRQQHYWYERYIGLNESTHEDSSTQYVKGYLRLFDTSHNKDGESCIYSCELRISRSPESRFRWLYIMVAYASSPQHQKGSLAGAAGHTNSPFSSTVSFHFHWLTLHHCQHNMFPWKNCYFRH